MKRSLPTIAGASALTLALAAPSASAGFYLHDYVLKPIISAAQILPPEQTEQTVEAEADESAVIRLSGQFCLHPKVYQGNTEGGFDRLYLDSNDENEIHAKLAESEPGVTYKFGVTCQLVWIWHVATIDVMVPVEEVEEAEEVES